MPSTSPRGRLRDAWRFLVTRPSTDSSRTAAYTLAALFCSSGVVGMVATTIARERVSDYTELMLVSFGAIPLGVVVALFGTRWPHWVFHVLMVTGTSTVVYSAWLKGPGTMSITMGTILVWIGLYGGYFFSPGATIGHLIYGYTLFGVAIASFGQSIAFEMIWLVWVALIIGVVSNLLARNRQQVRDRERLISVVSHELRTPLTPILGFSDLALRRDDALSSDTRQALEIIHRNGEQLSRVIDDLLLFARGRRGQLQRHPETLDLVVLVNDAVADFDIDAVEVDTDAAVYAFADRAQLTQLLGNLISNANTHGRPPITVSLAVRGRDVEIAVTDAGEGVPESFVPSLFEEFWQPGPHERRSASGLGLGLAIARDLARVNEATLRYEHAEPHGARFVLRLARHDPRDDETVRDGETGLDTDLNDSTSTGDRVSN